MEDKHNLETLVSVMSKLEAAGYVSQFRVVDDSLQSLLSGESFTPAEITVEHFYRFEGESSQDDEAILYAISANAGEKGTLVDGYGASNDSGVTVFMQKVQGMHK
ncbi:MAG: hypothetical protein EOO48_00645 [Flavobacterium sp.]|nr:MAG: hypothetical protein EOO48_00645 [Flavobacterium sp.]